MNIIFNKTFWLVTCAVSAAVWLLTLTTAQDATVGSDLVVPPSESVTTLHEVAGARAVAQQHDKANQNRSDDAAPLKGAATAKATRFQAIDVFVDSGRQTLAAWQFSLASETPGVEIVGIEGGEHAAFQKAPYYDPQAMQHNRVIVAAFSTATELPSGTSRVARVHVQLQGPGPKTYRSRLTVAADRDGNTIPARLSIAEAVAP